MASSQNANRILQTSFAQGLTNTAPLVQRAGRIISTGGARTVDIGGGAFGAIGATLTNTATTQALSDWFTFTASHTVTKKVVKHIAPVHTVNGDYGFEQLGAQLAQSAIKTFDKLFFDGLEGLFAANHPRQGVGDGLVGAGKKYLDTGLLLAGGATQDNLVASALDETSLNAAIKLMLQYRSDRGIPLHLGSNGGLVLVVSPANAKVAHELVVSQLSGQDNASNFVKGIVSDIVVWPFSTDDRDWFLIDLANAPVGMALGSDPTARIALSVDGLFYEAVAEVDCCFFKSPYEYGIIGSNVP
jgi:hypothetical protein